MRTRRRLDVQHRACFNLLETVFLQDEMFRRRTSGAEARSIFNRLNGTTKRRALPEPCLNLSYFNDRLVR
jgi:hypothetical protein